jgi:hypothetical protein
VAARIDKKQLYVGLTVIEHFFQKRAADETILLRKLTGHRVVRYLRVGETQIVHCHSFFE